MQAAAGPGHRRGFASQGPDPDPIASVPACPAPWNGAADGGRRRSGRKRWPGGPGRPRRRADCALRPRLHRRPRPDRARVRACVTSQDPPPSAMPKTPPSCPRLREGHSPCPDRARRPGRCVDREWPVEVHGECLFVLRCRHGRAGPDVAPDGVESWPGRRRKRSVISRCRQRGPSRAGVNRIPGGPAYADPSEAGCRDVPDDREEGLGLPPCHPPALDETGAGRRGTLPRTRAWPRSCGGWT